MLFGIIIVIVIATPTFLIVILPPGLAYYFVQVRNGHVTEEGKAIRERENEIGLTIATHTI